MRITHLACPFPGGIWRDRMLESAGYSADAEGETVTSMDNEQTNQSTEDAPQERSRFGQGAAGDRPSRPSRDRRESGGPRGGRGGGRRKQAVFADNEVVDYKDIQRLKMCLDERGKILPRRKTHCSAGKQRELTVAIKRARHLALLQYIPSDRRR